MATPNSSGTAVLFHHVRRRRRRRWLWGVGVLITLMLLLEFNPLHPIIWAHQMRDAWEQGARAGTAAKRERETRHAAQAVR